MLIVLLLLLGVGYAYLTANLSINGTAGISGANWDVHFENVNVTEGSVEATTPVIDVAKTTVSYNITLSEPGDFYEFTVDAKNGGTIDAMIGSITSKLNEEEITDLPAYLEYKVTYGGGLDIENNHLLAAGDVETYKVRIGYKSDISSDELPATDQSFNLSFSVLYKQSDDNAISTRITCEDGQYLPKGSKSCSTCRSYNYCLAGTYSFDDSKDQGLIACAKGSTSSSGATECRACNVGKTTLGPGQGTTYCPNWNGASTWETPTWNSDNTVTNSCIITSCKTPEQGTMVSGDNECIFTGDLYSYNSSSIGEEESIGPYYSQYVRNNKYCSAYMYTKFQVVNNIIKKEYLCFTIGGNGIVISNTNNGEYCFESPGSDSLESTYQKNVNVLKSVFGDNDSGCEETNDSYICKNNNPYYIFSVYKNGNCSIDYNDPRSTYLSSDYRCNGNPYCYIKNRRAACPSSGCLDGETEVEVYDRKKKKRYRKKLKDVTPDDLILCWDFDLGEFVFVEPLWIKQVETMNCYYLLKFSDGSILKVIGDHKIFDVDKGRFVNGGCDNELKIGSHVYNSKGEVVELVSWEKVNEEIDSYNIITNYHMNLFANGILTSCVFSNIYPVEDMKYVKTENETISLKDLDEIDEKYIHGLRLNEVSSNFRGNKKSTISYIKEYVRNLIVKEK